ncbi:MAG: T9SS type A sorting domain-containing protein [Bacteroidia bacterium]|jgi:hypothetical protein
MKRNVLFSILMGGAVGLLNAQQEVVFSVNMQGQTVAPEGVHVAGNWQSEAGLPADWDPSSAMMTDGGNGIYTYSCFLPDGVYEYKFINGNAWGGDESVPVECQVGGGNLNRFFSVNGASPLLYPVRFGESIANDGTTNYYMVRFTVDLTGTTMGAGGVSVAGSFLDEIVNGNFVDWTPGSALLNDVIPSDANSLFTGIFYFSQSLEGTSYEFKYINGQDGSGNNQWENVPSSCALNTNRSFTLAAGATVTQNCFASCSEVCVELPTFNATINIDMRYNCGFDVNSNDSVDVAGTFNNYQGGPAYLLSDVDNDGIYSITLPIDAGEFQYKARIIRNGNFSGGWEGGSNTSVMLQSDTTLSARCFGLAAGECTPIPPPSNVTFRVDMTDETPASTIYVIGDFTTPPYQGGALPMTLVGPGTYEASFNGICPGKINYKFVNGPVDISSNEESFPDSTDRDCAEPNGIGGFNRFYIRTSADPVTLSYKFNTCLGGSSSGLNDLTLAKAELFPNPAQNTLNILFADASSYKVDVLDLTGRVTNTISNARNSVVIQRGDLANGIYLVRLTSDNGTNEIVKVQFN